MTDDPDQWPSSEQLAQLFPAAYTPHIPIKRGDILPDELRGKADPRRPLRTKARMVLSLELRGKTTGEIAAQLGMHANTVSAITRTDRYIAAREVLLGRMDAEFSAMKPDAFRALSQGLRSRDENTALRASETWMKAAGFGQYGKGNQSQGLTAEDVARQLLQVNVNIVNQGKE